MKVFPERINQVLNIDGMVPWSWDPRLNRKGKERNPAGHQVLFSDSCSSAVWASHKRTGTLSLHIVSQSTALSLGQGASCFESKLSARINNPLCEQYVFRNSQHKHWDILSFAVSAFWLRIFWNKVMLTRVVTNFPDTSAWSTHTPHLSGDLCLPPSGSGSHSTRSSFLLKSLFFQHTTVIQGLGRWFSWSMLAVHTWRSEFRSPASKPGTSVCIWNPSTGGEEPWRQADPRNHYSQSSQVDELQVQ